MTTFFDRIAGAPRQNESPEPPPVAIPRGPLLGPIVPPSDHKSPPLEKTLDWLVNRWPKPSVRTRDFLRFGPNSIRNQKTAVAVAKSLEANGWLRPLPTHQHNMKLWQVVRGPSQ